MAGSAEASAILIVDSNGILLGATGVTVDGAPYDVEFLDGTCVAVFSGCDVASDFQFQTQGAAGVAAQALLDQVLLDGPLGQFDSSPALTNDCSRPTLPPPYANMPCHVYVPFCHCICTPWSPTYQSLSSIAVNHGYRRPPTGYLLV